MHPAFQILRIPTAPGHEDLVATFIRCWLGKLNIPFREDRHGNLIARLHTSNARSAIAFSVHMDHPGFEVLRCERNRIESAFLGGVPKSWFRRGTPVEFFDNTGKRTAQAVVVRVLKWDRKQRRILLRSKSGTTRKRAFGM